MGNKKPKKTAKKTAESSSGYAHRTNTTKAKSEASKSYRGASSSGPKICKNRMFGKRCKECEKVQELYNSEDEDDKKVAGKTRARSTFYMNIVDLDDKESGIQIYGCGIKIWRNLIDYLPEDDNDDEAVDFTDPSKAYAVLIKRTGKGLRTDYQVKVSTKPFKVPEKWMGKMNNLSDILETIEAAGDDLDLFVPEEGKNRLYIFPPWSEEADGDFYKEVFYHWDSQLLGLDDEDGPDGSDDEFADGDDNEFADDDDDGEFADDDEFDEGKGPKDEEDDDGEFADDDGEFDED